MGKPGAANLTVQYPQVEMSQTDSSRRCLYTVRSHIAHLRLPVPEPHSTHRTQRDSVASFSPAFVHHAEKLLVPRVGNMRTSQVS